jgi:isopenicillin N synthase-like dioxygenase
MAPHAEDDVPKGMWEPSDDTEEDASLVTISIEKLLARDKGTEETLLRASADLGFFYLDIRNHPSSRAANQIAQVTSTALEFYKEPQEEKSSWEVNKDHVAGEEIVCGYVSIGCHFRIHGHCG